MTIPPIQTTLETHLKAVLAKAEADILRIDSAAKQALSHVTGTYAISLCALAVAIALLLLKVC